MRRKRDEWKDNENDLSRNDPWLRSPWNTIWAYFILSFGTPNPGLHYVPRKSILIERGYLDWRGFSLKDSAKIILIKHSPVWDKFWIFKCIIGQWKMKKAKKKKKHDSRVKTRKGQSRAETTNFFLKTHGWNKQKNEGQRSDSIRNLYEVIYPSQNQKFELFVPECLPSNSRTYHGGSWRLSNCHIQELKKNDESF